jgi:mono/diheme cytochrome c family protein
MLKPAFVLRTISVLVLIVAFAISGWTLPDEVIPLQQGMNTPLPETTPETDEEGWILFDLPSDATQLEFGAEIYRLVCQDCHGDEGQGLTDEWRAKWAPEDQNCWQSKCHATNHPPDGFYMPIAPAVAGPPTQIFDTALDLFNYIHNFMPWHNRGSLTEEDAWRVTAYILKLNNIDPGVDLNPTTAAQIRVRNGDPSLEFPTSEVINDLASSQELHANEKINKIAPIWVIALTVVALILFVAIFMLYKQSA